jgi:hypothetical protein
VFLLRRSPSTISIKPPQNVVHEAIIRPRQPAETSSSPSQGVVIRDEANFQALQPRAVPSPRKMIVVLSPYKTKQAIPLRVTVSPLTESIKPLLIISAYKKILRHEQEDTSPSRSPPQTRIRFLIVLIMELRGSPRIAKTSLKQKPSTSK